MSVHTRSQKLAQAAYKKVAARAMNDKYKTFAKKFPALIHTCGLAQAVAFGLAKSEYRGYVDDLAAVLEVDDLGKRSRETNLSDYLLLSRNAINAASWLKRYVEAAAPDETEGE